MGNVGSGSGTRAPLGRFELAKSRGTRRAHSQREGEGALSCFRRRRTCCACAGGPRRNRAADRSRLSDHLPVPAHKEGREIERTQSGMMKRMLSPARSEHAGPTPRLWKKNLPNTLRVSGSSAQQCMHQERTWAGPDYLREAGGHGGPEQVVARKDGRRDRRVRALQVPSGAMGSQSRKV